MGWKASFSVRVSGLEDGTLTDVLEAVAVFVDDRDLTSECYPALTSIMTIARKSRNVVRAALKELVSQGLLSFRQENGEKRYYRVHLNLLPQSKIATFRTEPGKELTPVQKCTGFRSEPGSEVNGEGVQKCTPTGFRSEPGPGSEVNPEERRNRELNREEEKSSSAHTCEEPPFDDALFDEAIRVVETEVAPESPPEKKQKQRKARTSVATVERPNDLSEQLWQDWLALRKAKRAPLNTTTINTFRAEARKAGISFEEAVSFSVANGYQGFKADWYRKNASTFTNGRPHQGYAGFGARNTAEIDYNFGLPVRGSVG